jgi:uracil-DNA glycosylase family 4
LRHELNELAIQPKEIYLTNAVKHFKNIKIDGRQMHRSPDIKEVNACKPWLLAEIELVKPKVILCLGVTPSKALINPGFKMTTLHGKWQPYDETKTVIAGTYHPSALLRAPTPEAKESMLKVFKEDLQKAFELASGSG